MEIPLNRIGKIKSGDNKGWEVSIEPCSSNYESYLILVSPDFSAQDTNGYDDWVEDYESLQQYFIESKWLISWQ